MAGKIKTSIMTIERAEALELLPRREPGAHKWSVGGLVIVGGAPGYVGAPALCARAAMRAGAGIVSIAVSRSSIPSIAGIVPEATFLSLADGEPATSARKAFRMIAERAEKSAAFVVGPGLSTDEHACALMAELFGFTSRRSDGVMGFGARSASVVGESEASLVGSEKPAVIDADGLNWLANQREWWTQVKPQSLLLTPHAGEMARLTGKSADEIAASPEISAVTAATSWQQTVLLKGAKAILTDGSTTLVAGDTPLSLATAGTGDILSGMAGAFLAQGLSLLDAGRLAIFVGTAAARDVEATYGTLGLLASDLPNAIAKVLADMERS